MNDADSTHISGFPLTNNSGKLATDADSTEQRQTRRTPPPKRPRSQWTYTKWALAGLFCLFCMIGGTVFGSFYWRSAAFRGAVGSFMIHLPQVIMQRDPMAAWTPEQQLPADKQHVVTVLLLGCDADYEEARPVVLKGTLTRSDAILIARVDFDNKTINVLSIPRDSAVRIPGHGLHKINAAHALGGPELTQETIKEVFGITTDYYITLGFEGFQKVVNAVGGVDVTVHKQLDYDDNWGNLHVHLQPGFQHLNGYKAMGYVRIRHSDSDLIRAERQHEFLEALRDKVKSPSSLLKLPDVMNAVSDSIKSNMTQDQMMTLANFARQAGKERIQLATLPCTEGPSYVYIDEAQSKEVIGKLFFNGDTSIVNISVPGRFEVARITGRSTGRGRHRRANPVADANAPRDDNGELLSNDSDVSMTEGNGTIRDADPSEGDISPFPDKTDKPKTGETGSPSPKGTGSEKTDKGEKDKGTKDKGEKKDPGSGTGSGTDAGTGGDKDRTGTGDSGKPE